jgi:hypothetical protein
MRKLSIALTATMVMMLAAWADSTTFAGAASLREKGYCGTRHDRCPPGFYFACTLDMRCTCNSCYYFRHYPDNDYWYRWR